MYKSVIGKKFGRLLIEDEEKVSGRAVLKCLCDCGKRIVTRRDAVLSGKSKSCGCLQREKAKEVNYKHGYYKERLYHVWDGMKQRCDNPNHVAYHNYGGRGIKVCEEWSSNYVVFREFMLANGYDSAAPFGQCTIDRIDNDGDYCPENCRIITVQEQQNGKGDVFSFILDGKRTTLNGAARERKITRSGIIYRLNKGMTLDEAINTPLREVNTYEADGKVLTLKEWAKILDTTVNVLYGRLLTHTMQEIYDNWKRDGKIDVKICKKVLYTVNGETHCRAEWSRILGIPVSTLKYKLKKKTMEEIYNDVFGS